MNEKASRVEEATIVRSANVLSRIGSSKPMQVLLGRTLGAYLRFVRLTNRIDLDPPDLYERCEPDRPLICAMWHGQHFMIPFFKRPQDRGVVLISRHEDGAIMATACERFGLRVIRASGGEPERMIERGGVTGLREMLRALSGGENVALTADRPKQPRIAGMGIVTLGRLSARPIYPVAVVTSRRITLGNWDRTTIALPFGHGIIAIGAPVRVARHADAAAADMARRAVEAGLDEVHQRAYALVGGGDPGIELGALRRAT